MPIWNDRRAFLAAAILALTAPAYAVKPQPPVTVDCHTVDQKGLVYTAECRVEAHGGQAPANVALSPVQEKGTLIAKYTAEAANGMGKWTIVFETHEKTQIPVYFDAHYQDGTAIRVTAIYDPYGVLATPKSGVPVGVVKGSKGGGVKEYPSN